MTLRERIERNASIAVRLRATKFTAGMSVPKVQAALDAFADGDYEICRAAMVAQGWTTRGPWWFAPDKSEPVPEVARRPVPAREIPADDGKPAYQQICRMLLDLTPHGDRKRMAETAADSAGLGLDAAAKEALRQDCARFLAHRDRIAALGSQWNEPPPLVQGALF